MLQLLLLFISSPVHTLLASSNNQFQNLLQEPNITTLSQSLLFALPDYRNFVQIIGEKRRGKGCKRYFAKDVEL